MNKIWYYLLMVVFFLPALAIVIVILAVNLLGVIGYTLEDTSDEIEKRLRKAGRIFTTPVKKARLKLGEAR